MIRCWMTLKQWRKGSQPSTYSNAVPSILIWNCYSLLSKHLEKVFHKEYQLNAKSHLLIGWREWQKWSWMEMMTVAVWCSEYSQGTSSFLGSYCVVLTWLPPAFTWWQRRVQSRDRHRSEEKSKRKTLRCNITQNLCAQCADTLLWMWCFMLS